MCVVHLPGSVERGQHTNLWLSLTASPGHVIFSACDECCHVLTVGSMEL